MSKCTRCGDEMGDVIRYPQMVDENRNWGVRTEDMKALCQECAGEVMAFANTPIKPRLKSGKRNFSEATTSPSSTGQEK